MSSKTEKKKQLVLSKSPVTRIKCQYCALLPSMHQHFYNMLSTRLPRERPLLETMFPTFTNAKPLDIFNETLGQLAKTKQNVGIFSSHVPGDWAS